MSSLTFTKAAYINEISCIRPCLSYPGEADASLRPPRLPSQLWRLGQSHRRDTLAYMVRESHANCWVTVSQWRKHLTNYLLKMIFSMLLRFCLWRLLAEKKAFGGPQSVPCRYPKNWSPQSAPCPVTPEAKAHSLYHVQLPLSELGYKVVFGRGWTPR